MLKEYLEEVLRIGGNVLEIEYRDGQEWFTAFKGPMGIGIGNVSSSQSEAIYDEMMALKKQKQIVYDGKTYQLGFSKRESFGEWVYYIEVKAQKAKPVTRPLKKKPTK